VLPLALGAHLGPSTCSNNGCRGNAVGTNCSSVDFQEGPERTVVHHVSRGRGVLRRPLRAST
jgi:hypothetical protein